MRLEVSLHVAHEKNGRNLDERHSIESTISDISKIRIDGNEIKEKYRDPGTRAARSLKNIIRNVEILYNRGKGTSVADDTVSNALVLSMLHCYCTPPVMFIPDHTILYYGILYCLHT